MSDPESNLDDELAEFAAGMRLYITERDAALLSMDRDTILAFGKKHKVDWNYDPSQGYDPDKEYWFWVAIHFTRSEAKTLPNAAREESRRWLEARGLNERWKFDEQ